MRSAKWRLQRPERRVGGLRLLDRAGEARQREDDRRPVVLGRNERHRRAGHHVGDNREVLRRGIRRRDEPGEGLRRCRKDQHPAHDGVHGVEPVPEARHDAEAAAAATERPEQVGMAIGVCDDHLAVRRHDLDGEQAVNGETVLADEVADAAAERDPADAHRTRVTEAGREAVLADRHRVGARGHAPTRPGRPCLRVDVQHREVTDVDHDTAVDHAVPGTAVATRSDGDLEAGFAGEGDGGAHVVRVRDPDDDGRAAVDAAEDDGPGRVVVAVVGGTDEGAAERRAECLDVEDGGLRGRHRWDLLRGREDRGSGSRRWSPEGHRSRNPGRHGPACDPPPLVVRYPTGHRPLRTLGDLAMTQRCILLVGTPKGAFILDGDDARRGPAGCGVRCASPGRSTTSPWSR